MTTRKLCEIRAGYRATTTVTSAFRTQATFRPMSTFRTLSTLRVLRGHTKGTGHPRKSIRYLLCLTGILVDQSPRPATYGVTSGPP